jgi:uncharacterized protein YeaO (DUF488 family)
MKKKRLNIRIKRIYEDPDDADGKRVLVDRLWPRGLTKEKAQVELWVKEIAPSSKLRQWYAHDPSKWKEFKTRYAAELDANSGNVEELLHQIQNGMVTFLYGSKEEQLNNAVALKEYLESKS